MSEKRPRNWPGRSSVRFGPSTVREFQHKSLAKNGVNSILPAPRLGPKEKPGNWNSLPSIKRPNGQIQSQPIVPHLAPNNTRRQVPELYSEEANAIMAEPLAVMAKPVIGTSNASLWTRLSKGGRRRTRKRNTRKRS